MSSVDGYASSQISRQVENLSYAAEQCRTALQAVILSALRTLRDQLHSSNESHNSESHNSDVGRCPKVKVRMTGRLRSGNSRPLVGGWILRSVAAFFLATCYE